MCHFKYWSFIIPRYFVSLIFPDSHSRFIGTLLLRFTHKISLFNQFHLGLELQCHQQISKLLQVGFQQYRLHMLQIKEVQVPWGIFNVIGSHSLLQFPGLTDCFLLLKLSFLNLSVRPLIPIDSVFYIIFHDLPDQTLFQGLEKLRQLVQFYLHVFHIVVE